MENKKSLKKIVLIIVLIIILAGIVLIVVNSSSGKKEVKTGNSNKTSVTKTNGAQSTNSNNTTVKVSDNTKNVTKTELSDGTLYSLTDEKVVPDIVVGDKFYDTQIADMTMNFNNYEGKTIEIEGYHLTNGPYTFVGRYSLSNLCADCPAGYSYFEYEWKGNEKVNLKEEDDWIKVVGKLKRGNDGTEYYYIDVLSLEVMKEKGLDTVSN